MRGLLLAVTLLASCEGRCSRSNAVQDALPDGFCVTDVSMALCTKGDQLFLCSLAGNMFHTASCSPIATILHSAEAR